MWQTSLNRSHSVGRLCKTNLNRPALSFSLAPDEHFQETPGSCFHLDSLCLTRDPGSWQYDLQSLMSHWEILLRVPQDKMGPTTQQSLDTSSVSLLDNTLPIHGWGSPDVYFWDFFNSNLYVFFFIHISGWIGSDSNLWPHCLANGNREFDFNSLLCEWLGQSFWRWLK